MRQRRSRGASRGRKKNPIGEAMIFAAGTTVGIIFGTVIATWIVESLRASGQLPGSSPALPGNPSPYPIPPPGA